MIGVGSAIAGTAIALGSAITGAVASSNAAKKANKMIAKQRAENKQWYNAKMAEDYITRSDAQAVLKKQRELLNEQYQRARATNIVAGGTDESLALQQQAANKSMSDTMSNIASEASAYKDSAEQAYRQQDAALNQQQVQVQQQKAANIAQAAGQGVSAGLNLIGGGISKSNA